MKIKMINDDIIIFDNGNEITFDHWQNCCEYNYADFKQIEEIALTTEFNDELVFEQVDTGFRFGNKNGKMFYIPCYSEQNGYFLNLLNINYNPNLLNINYNSKEVITGIDCEEIIY